MDWIKLGCPPVLHRETILWPYLLRPQILKQMPNFKQMCGPIVFSEIAKMSICIKACRISDNLVLIKGRGEEKDLSYTSDIPDGYNFPKWELNEAPGMLDQLFSSW